MEEISPITANGFELSCQNNVEETLAITQQNHNVLAINGTVSSRSSGAAIDDTGIPITAHTTVTNHLNVVTDNTSIF